MHFLYKATEKIRLNVINIKYNNIKIILKEGNVVHKLVINPSILDRFKFEKLLVDLPTCNSHSSFSWVLYSFSFIKSLQLLLTQVRGELSCQWE